MKAKYDINTVTVESIEFFDNSYETKTSEFEAETTKAYSANIKLNFDGVEIFAQISGNQDEANPIEIPFSEVGYYNIDEQNGCAEYFNENLTHDLLSSLEERGEIENNFGFLEEHSA